MKLCIGFCLPVLLLCHVIPCFAEWDCDDWVSRRGYCVDYVKSKIPSFPIPTSEKDIMQLKNRDVGKIAPGDVAIFDLGRYWHVAYVEHVHRDQFGKAVAIDVSEKNFGDRLTLSEFRKTWKTPKTGEWKRAQWCGVTKKFDQIGVRRYIDLATIDQVWSPRAGNKSKIIRLVDALNKQLSGMLQLFTGGN